MGIKKNLVIVESPAKCHTIARYLGDDFVVLASLGHICDLATSGKGGLGLDIEAGFKPSYIINKDKAKVVKELEIAAKSAKEVILATDPDREGEAIAWHLARVLNLDIPSTKRLEFHEITRISINDAMNNPRHIDMNLVFSQETRRIIDRIIGFKLSSLLNKKINSRSAGRVQSATLKLICDHEKEIIAFVPEEYWNVNASIKVGEKEIPVALLDKDENGKSLHSEKDADAILNALSKEAKVVNIKKTLRTKESKEPFITSTLQQEAFNRYKFKTKKTQSIAQKLYEGIALGDETVGLITYMRTDSARLSSTFISKASTYILENYGEKYLGQQKRIKDSVLAQDAHEAIRPTSCFRTPYSIKKYLTPDQYHLYKLIYNRTLASLMTAKKEEATTISFDSNGVSFNIQGTVTIFDGYTAIYGEQDAFENALPKMEKGEVVPIYNAKKEQFFTKPPVRYSEAKIVKMMEELGIGRPSTYASTIETLQNRKYVVSNGGILTPTEQGMLTSTILNKYFPKLVNAKYTAGMEEELDKVQGGTDDPNKIISSFYYPFIKEIEDAYKMIYPEPPKETGEVCPKCGAPLIIKKSKNGEFVGCSNFPKCKYIKKEPKVPPVFTGENCPECGKPLVERKDAKGRTFIACSGYPTCHYIKGNEKEVFSEQDKVKKCPECDGWLVKKKGKYGYFLGCSNYPTCHHMEKIIKNKK